MATYLQNGVDEFPKQELHTPDFSFLTKVLGTQQERYKKGFSLVRNMYNSMLNGAVTSTDSEQYKQDVFKKIKGQMQDISGLDLSQTQNVATANGVFDPLTKDKELLYDMYATKKFSENAAIADRYKNSMDADTRAKYNPASVMDMQFAREDLRNAKRGDGSIFGVAPRDYVPQEDIDKFLDERAGKDGFKVERDVQNGMYILKRTNGEEAVPIFSEWAKRAMGNRFDPQLQVQASVAVEQKVRGAMAQGMTREDAIKSIIPEYTASTTKLYEAQHRAITKEIGNTNLRIRQFEKAFPNGIKDPEQKARYDSYVAQKKDLEQMSENTLEEAQGVQATAEANPQAMLNNMKTMMYTSHKNNIANSWGSSKAMREQKTEISADQVKIAQWQNNEKILAASTDFERKIHLEGLKSQNAAKLEVLKNQIKNGPTEPVYAGAFTPEPVNPYEVDNTRLSDKQEDIYNSGSKILSEMLGVGDNAKDNASAYSAVRSIANGAKLHQNDIQKIQTLLTNLGVKNSIPTTSEQAKVVMHNIGVRIHQKSIAEIAADKTGKKHKNYQATAMENGKLLRSLSESEELSSEMQSGYRNVFLDASGNVKDGYEEYVKVIGYERPDAKGNRKPTIAFTGKPIPEALQKQMNGEASRASIDSAALSGSMFLLNMNAGELVQALNTNSSKSNDIEDKALKELLKSNPSTVAALFGKGVQAKFNPATKTTTLTFTTDLTNPDVTKYKASSGSKGVKTNTFSVELDNNVLKNLSPTFNKLVTEGTVKFKAPLLLKEFETHPYWSTTNLNSAWKALGISSEIGGYDDPIEGYGINTTMSFVRNGIKEDWHKFYPIREGSRASDLAEAEAELHTLADGISVMQRTSL